MSELTHEDAMRAVLSTVGPDGIDGVEFVERVLHLMGEHGDAEEIARDIGIEPGARVRTGENFTARQQ